MSGLQTYMSVVISLQVLVAPSCQQNTAISPPEVVINELSIDGESQYVELYDGSVGSTPFDGLVLVLFSGASETIYGQPLVLDGYRTDEKGYFLVSFGPALPNADAMSPTVLFTSGLNAVVLYNGTDNNDLQTGSVVTGVNLVDAVVYGSSADPEGSMLLGTLSAGEYPVPTDVSIGGGQPTSLSRCRGWRQLMQKSFQTTDRSPAADNICTLPSLVLNELNPSSETNGGQFIEIFDGGIGSRLLDGIMLVGYKGLAVSDNIFFAVDLTGYQTDGSGFLVLAGEMHGYTTVPVPLPFNRGRFLPDRASVGIALHLGPPQRFAVDKPISTYNLIDAVVYVYQREADLALISWLTPGQDTHVDAPSTDGRDYSISRCYCCTPRNSSAFGRAPISPGSINRECSIANHTVIETPVVDTFRINEVHIGTSGTTDGDFVEIYDGGFGPAPLTGRVFVAYSGTENGAGGSYQIFDLSKHVTNQDGFLLIGPSSVRPSPKVTIGENDWLRSGLGYQGAGAVALYKADVVDFQLGQSLSGLNLLDAVVYGNESSATSGFLAVLLPDQPLVHNYLPNSGSSLVRCYSHYPLDQVAFAVGQPSPAAANVCPKPPLVLNEVNLLPTSSTGLWVEVSSSDIPNFPLDMIIRVLWIAGEPVVGRAWSLAGQRTKGDGLRSDNMEYARRFSGPFGVALYFAPDVTDLYDEDQAGTIRLTDVGLMDAVVIGQDDSPVEQTLLNILTPGRPQVQEREAFSHRDESLSRCMINGSWTFVPAHVSRDAPNHCPTRLNPDVIINEINLATDHQFIELFDLGAGYTLLDEFVVVLYNENVRVKDVIPLSGYATDASGYFVLGVRTAISSGNVHYPLTTGFMDRQYGAVALYKSSGVVPIPGDLPTTQGLVDAVVYADEGRSVDPMLQTLISSTSFESLLSDNERFSRCFFGDLRSSRAFGSRPATIAAMNNCPVFPSDVVINELNVGMPGTAPVAFVEVYDGGKGNTALEYLSLVIFSAGVGGSTRAIDLSGYSTNDKGYFVIGSKSIESSSDLVIIVERQRDLTFLPTGAGAAALYRAPPGAFPHAAPATKTSLVDATVYTTDLGEPTTLVEELLPEGNSIIFEDKSHLETDESISRCFDDSRLTQSAYNLTRPTPKKRNACGTVKPTMTSSGMGLSTTEVVIIAVTVTTVVILFIGLVIYICSRKKRLATTSEDNIKLDDGLHFTNPSLIDY